MAKSTAVRSHLAKPKKKRKGVHSKKKSSKNKNSKNYKKHIDHKEDEIKEIQFGSLFLYIPIMKYLRKIFEAEIHELVSEYRFDPKTDNTLEMFDANDKKFIEDIFVENGINRLPNYSLVISKYSRTKSRATIMFDPNCIIEIFKGEDAYYYIRANYGVGFISLKCDDREGLEIGLKKLFPK